MKRFIAVAALAFAACASDDVTTPESGGPVFGAVTRDPALTIVREADRVSGSLDDGAIHVTFVSEMVDKDIVTRIELDGMVLLATHGANGTAELSARTADGELTLITEPDRAAIRRLLAALESELAPPVDAIDTKDEYDGLRRLTPAEYRLLRVTDAIWSEFPTSMVPEITITDDEARSWRSARGMTKAGQQVMGCHDCGSCSWSSLNTTDCCDSAPLGGYFSGDNYGNCGTSSTGTQYSWDCVNHDQCVRTSKHGGHSIISFYCNDQFTAASDDETSSPSCDYDWRNSQYYGACPSSWIGTHDGCDCFCGVVDPDCNAASSDAHVCNYNWFGTTSEGKCPQSWNSAHDGCDCGCQFYDYDCY